MSRLPTPGSDNGSWGYVLNDYLAVSISSDGTLKPNSVDTAQIKDSAVTAAKLNGLDAATAALVNNAVSATTTALAGIYVKQTSATTTYATKTDVANSMLVTSSSQTGSTYTFALADAGTVVEGSSTGAQVFTVPPSSSIAWVVGMVIEIFQAGAGQISIAAGVGVTLQNPSSLNMRAQYGTLGLRYRGSNVWAVSGDLA